MILLIPTLFQMIDYLKKHASFFILFLLVQISLSEYSSDHQDPVRLCHHQSSFGFDSNSYLDQFKYLARTFINIFYVMFLNLQKYQMLKENLVLNIIVNLLKYFNFDCYYFYLMKELFFILVYLLFSNLNFFIDLLFYLILQNYYFDFYLIIFMKLFIV